ncbi:MAG: hypothetical protein QRY72_02000 [Candidatus Rhabdochlamydia sp.]
MINQKILKSGLVGGLILFIWGMFSWIVLPLNRNQYKPFMNEKAVYAKIQENTAESGLYMLPYMNCQNQKEVEAMQHQMKDGPVIFMAVAKEGASLGMVGSFVIALVMNVAAATIVAWILAYTRLTDMAGVMPLTLAVGFLTGWMSGMPFVIWFHFPLSFALLGLVDSVIGWSLAGWAMTKMMVKE